MLQIKDLLGGFKRIEDPAECRRIAASVMNAVLKTAILTENDIEYSDNECVFHMKANPAVRHKILISKERCLDLLRSALPKLTIKDIR